MTLENARASARSLGLVLLTTGSLFAAACATEAEEPIPDEEISSTAQFLYAPPECKDPAVLAAMNAAAVKYGLPRWFVYAVVHRESSFNPRTLNPNDGGQGLTQLTGADHQAYPYPFGLSAPNNSYQQWIWNMGLNVFGPWVDMKDVTPLASYEDAFHPAHNLERYASVYAAPAYFLFQASQGPADNLRRVAYHWFYGVFEDGYPNDPGNYLGGQWGYDALVAQYKPKVEAEDGVWTGPPCKPPYSSAGCGATKPPSPSPSPSPVSCTPTTYEAEGGSVTRVGAGELISDGWYMWDNGYVSLSRAFVAGAATITVRARGEQAQGGWPHMVVTVGGVKVGEANVSATAWTSYTFRFTAAAGTQSVRVTYDNDLYASPEDRNLLLDKIVVGCG